MRSECRKIIYGGIRKEAASHSLCERDLQFLNLILSAEICPRNPSCFVFHISLCSNLPWSGRVVTSAGPFIARYVARTTAESTVGTRAFLCTLREKYCGHSILQHSIRVEISAVEFTVGILFFEYLLLGKLFRVPSSILRYVESCRY